MACRYHPYPYEENRNSCTFPYYSIFGDIKVDIDTFDVCGSFQYCVDLVDSMTKTAIHIDGATFESLVFQLQDLVTANTIHPSLPVNNEKISVKPIPLSRLYKVTHISGSSMAIDINIIWGFFEIFIQIENERIRRMSIYSHMKTLDITHIKN